MKKRLVLAVALALVVVCAMPTMAMAAAKTKTKLGVSISSSSEHYDSVPTIKGTLKTSKGKAIKGQTVKLYCNGKYVATKKTDSKGRVKFKAMLPDNVTNGSWKLKYKGTKKYKAATSKAVKSKLHVHFDGPATPIATDVDDDGQTLYVFKIERKLEKGRTYFMAFGAGVYAEIDNLGTGKTVFTSGDDVVDLLEFTAPADGTYAVIVVTRADWGGGPALDAFIY